jgi:hypothetical protein
VTEVSYNCGLINCSLSKIKAFKTNNMLFKDEGGSAG